MPSPRAMAARTIHPVPDRVGDRMGRRRQPASPRCSSSPIPVIRSPPIPFHPRDELPAIIRFAARRPLAWIDDTLSAEAHAGAAERRTPTLLISIDPADGLTRPVIEQSLQWADSQRHDDQLQT
jgi:hypothetical protein